MLDSKRGCTSKNSYVPHQPGAGMLVPSSYCCLDFLKVPSGRGGSQCGANVVGLDDASLGVQLARIFAASFGRAFRG